MIELGGVGSMNLMASRAKDSMDLSSRASNQPARSSNPSALSSRGSNWSDKKFSDEIKNIDAPEAARESHVESPHPEAGQESTAQNKIQSRDESDDQNQSQPVTQKEAMQVFLSRIQNEFGVPPKTVLQAFSKLEPSDLIAPPEESAQKVVSELGLDPAATEKALGYYNEMLAMTAAAGLSAHLIQNQKEAQFQVLTKKEAQAQALRTSLNDMSNRFFVTGSHSVEKMAPGQNVRMSKAYAAQMHTALDSASQPGVSAEQQSLTAQYENPKGFAFSSVAEADLGVAMGAMPGESANAGSGAGSSSGALDISQMTPVQEPFDPAASHELASSETAQAQNMDMKVAQPEIIVPEAHSQSYFESSARGTIEAAPAPDWVSLSQAENSPNDGFMSESGEDSENSSAQDGGGMYVGATAPESRAGKPVDPNSFAVQMPKATAADVQNNVREIISQAQFLSQKGGGEMKVALNPEGLGEVNLKVKTVNGQVNVEMLTTNDEAKKVLEKGLGELKENLAAHKLHLDSVKIEQSKDISGQLDQQQRDAEQGFQHKFLSDFRERNQNFRREMFEFGAPSVPSSQRRDRAANAIYDPQPRRRADSSRRLDLVA